MKNIRIQGLKSLLDSKTIPIKPITILVGENSSGKSTFLRTFPLLRQSIESAKTGPILWYGPYVDFGLFDDAVSKFSNNRKISFSFSLSSDEVRSGVPRPFLTSAGIASLSKENDNYDISTSLSIESDSKEKTARVSSIDIMIKDINIKIDFGKTNKILKAFIDSIDITDAFNNVLAINTDSAKQLLPNIRFKESRFAHYHMFGEFSNENIKPKIDKTVKPYLYAGQKPETITNKIMETPIMALNDFIDRFKGFSRSKLWDAKLKTFDENNQDAKNLHAYCIAYKCPWLIFIINNCIVSQLYNIKYIAPLRATAERYYRVQDLNVSEVDYQGKNLAMFLKNLSEKEKENYAEWLQENFGFKLHSHSDGGHLSLKIEYLDSKYMHNVADMGFGFSQMLPIITQLWYSCNAKQKSDFASIISPTNIIAIEQPELHLHPRYQSKLVDTLIKAIDLAKQHEREIKLIIETHSETIINCIGKKIFDKQLGNNDVSVVIFDKKEPDTPTNVELSSYDDKGNLINWPWGFFEA